MLPDQRTQTPRPGVEHPVALGPKRRSKPEESLIGLSSAEAKRRLAQFGPNASPDITDRPLQVLLGKFIAPVSALLEAAIALQLFLGEYVEASIIGVLLVFNAVLGFVHESRAQTTITALKSRLALWANVRRDGTWVEVAASELVPGDVIKLSLGKVVPADVRLVSGGVLLDQSMITGESLPAEAGPGVETYAGVLIRRGEAVAVVTATGTTTKFGRTAELVRTARAASAEQTAIFKVVRNLAIINGVIAAALIAYAYALGLPNLEFIQLGLIAVLATVPVALPATFTLASALAAQSLAKRGVLPTRLSAVDEAASMDVLCSDKTGTLTLNELAVTSVYVTSGFDEATVLGLAALASSEGGADPLDEAVRTAAATRRPERLPTLVSFVPFDPAAKMAEAVVSEPTGETTRVVKGAFATVARLCQATPGAAEAAEDLEAQGHRVLGVAAGNERTTRIAGL